MMGRIRPVRETYPARLSGIPCQVEVEVYPGHPEVWRHGMPDEPADPGWYEIVRVLDRRGRPALWLERKAADPTIFWSEGPL